MSDKSIKAGVIFALCAYTIWGVAPMYFKLLVEMPAAEILVHRIVWSIIVLTGFVLIMGQFPQVQQALKRPKIIMILLISGVLLAINWLIFIWAVNNDALLDASLGYYINPLLNVFLGRIFLQERLRPLQKAAVGLAIFGVVLLVISFGDVPWVALTLAMSFGTYGLLRKQVAVDSLPGLFVETLMMLPFAIVYWVMFATATSDMFSNTLEFNLILVSAGLLTTVPLLCFTAAARRIRYSTLGFFQYIGPSIMFALAVLFYNEPLDQGRLMTFSFVWAALFLYSFDSLRDYRKSRGQASPTT